jgi:hypothetical protein
MRVCSKCNQIKALSEFHCGGTINGKTYVRGDCKVCQRKVVKNRTESIKQDYISWKRTLKCNRCDNNDHRALQFHHHRDKEHNISSMLSGGFSLDNIKKEADKCEVLCANCHQILHYKD